MGLARYEFSELESVNFWARPLTASFKAGLEASHKKLVDALGAIFGRVLVHFVDQETYKLLTIAKAFQTLRLDLIAAIEESGVSPTEDLVRRADEMQRTMQRLRDLARDVTYGLRTVNPTSRSAGAFDHFEAAVAEVQGAIYRFRLVAIGADGVADMTWEQAVEAGRRDFHAAAAKVDDLSTDDIDPAVLAMAMRAVSADKPETVR